MILKPIFIAYVSATELACKPKKMACDQLIKICQTAGFVPNAGHKGFDLWRDCINPIMQNQSKPTYSIYDLPEFPSELPNLCRKVRPGFGNGTVGGNEGSCSVIRRACTAQKFSPSNKPSGNQLFRNCINPLLQNVTDHFDAMYDLPDLKDEDIQKCKRENPDYGKGPVGNDDHDHSPCFEIKKACEQRGFRKGKSRCGYSTWENCINPIMQSLTAHADNLLPLPHIRQETIEACKNDDPNYGKGTVGGPIHEDCSSCQKIKQECKDEGFEEGKELERYDLWKHCIIPNIIQTHPDPEPLREIPCIDSNLIEKCLFENPKFGFNFKAESVA